MPSTSFYITSLFPLRVPCARVPKIEGDVGFPDVGPKSARAICTLPDFAFTNNHSIFLKQNKVVE